VAGCERRPGDPPKGDSLLPDPLRGPDSARLRAAVIGAVGFAANASMEDIWVKS
jgi:hypothetical protein